MQRFAQSITTRWLSLAVTALLVAAPALAASVPTTAVVEGDLQMAWGDAAPYSNPQPGSRFEVGLVTADGHLLRLDPDAARHAAGDLHALYGQRVAVALDDAAPTAAFGGALAATAIVAAAPPTATAAASVSGSQPWATLMCRFAGNSSQPKTKAYFNAMYGTSAGELGHYWQQVSYGKINVAGSAAYGWATLPYGRGHYVTTNSNGGKTANLDLLFADCTAALDAQVDFRQFVGVALVFNDELDDYAWGGNRWATLDGQYRSWRVTWQPPWSYAHLAPTAHEMGHGFGLPHANNSDQDADPYDNPWDVMSDDWSNATQSPVYLTLPKHVSIFSRDLLGWVDANRKLVINANGVWPNVVLSFAELAAPTGYREIVIRPPGSPASRYFTLEARQKAGTYDGNLAGTAVIIHDVDTTREEPAWSVDRRVPPADRANNRESMFMVGDSYDLTADVHVDVVAAAADGFLVTLQVGTQSDVIFKNGFEP